MPKAAKVIAINVDLFIFSLKKNQAKAAVMKGIELSVKSVAATVVLVIACKKAIPAKASKNPATIPNQPIPANCLSVDFLYLKTKTSPIAMAKAIDL